MNLLSNVLVLGGAGYIGGLTTEKLVAAGHNVVVYDNLLYEDRYMKPVKFVFGDVRDTDKIISVCAENKINTVVLMAALVGDPACNVNQELTREINFLAVKNLCERLDKSIKIIFMSTCSVYGVSSGIVNEDSPTNPISSYASTKLMAEKYVADRGGLIFRLGTVFGIGDNFSRIRADLVVNTLVIKAFTKGEITVNGGEQWRPIIAVEDIANYVSEAVVNNLQGTYIIALKNTTIKDLATEVLAAIPGIKVNYTPSLFQDERSYRVDTSRAENAFYYRPRRTVYAEVIRMYNMLVDKRIKDPDNVNYVNGLFLAQKRF